MPYTVRNLATDLLGYLKPQQRTFPPTATEDNPLPSVLAALNGAKNELAILGPDWSFNTRRSIALRAPTTITVTGGWTQYATTITVPDIQSWMLGCTVRFGTEPYNEIMAISGTTVTLTQPFLNAGAGTGIVYHNSVTPDTDVLKVMEPVSVADNYRLAPIYSPTDFNSVEFNRDMGRYTGDYASGFSWEHSRWFSGGGNGIGEPLIEDHPHFYFVEKVWAGTATPAAKRIRLAPMPDTAQVLHYRVMLSPPEWVLTDIYTVASPSVDPAKLVPYEDARIITSLLPVARFRFAASPVMADSKAREQIKNDYQRAIEAEAKLKPNATGLQGNVAPSHW